MKIYSLNPQYAMNLWMAFGLLEQPYQDNFRQLLHRAVIACGLDAVARNIYYREQSIMNLLALCFNYPKVAPLETVCRSMYMMLTELYMEEL